DCTTTTSSTSRPFPYATLFRSVLVPKGIVRVFVKETSGVSVANANVTLASSGGAIQTATDASGFATVDGVSAGSITASARYGTRSEEHTSELQSRFELVCRHVL